MKRLFFFTHWYPPNSTAPAFRSVAWVKGLQSHFDEIIVITPYRSGNESYPQIRKQNLIEERKENVRIFRLPHQSSWFSRTINRMPDGWQKRALMGLYFLWKKHPIHHAFEDDFLPVESQLPKPQSGDWVLSSGPPFILHRLALRWKLQYNMVWIADYRDLWTIGKDRFHWGWMHDTWVRINHHFWEKYWLHHANYITTVGNKLADDLQQSFPTVPVYTVENGYEDDILTIPPAETLGNRWLFVGNLYPQQESIETFLQAVLQRKKHQPEQIIKIRWLGSNQYGVLSQMIQKYPELTSLIELYPWQSRKEVLEHYTWSTGLIHFPYIGSEYIPSAKMLEYLGARRKILIWGSDGYQAHLLHQFPEIGVVGEQPDTLETFISRTYPFEKPTPVGYSRSEQVAQFVSKIDL